jgi:ACS family glucarate transporter-like MFS transporter
VKGLRWAVLAVIILASFVAYVLRTNVNIVGEAMIRDLGMSTEQLGIVFSAFAAGYALFQIPGGMIGNRFGPRLTITALGVLWCVLTVITALMPGGDRIGIAWIVAGLATTRFLVGMTNAPFFPVTTGGTIERWFPETQWGLPNGLSSTGLTLGAAATAPLVVWCMEAWGWRNALLITAPAGLIAALAYWTVVRDEPAEHPLITQPELHFIRSIRPPVAAGHDRGMWVRVLLNRNILLVTLSYFCMNYVFYLFFNWFFFYLVDVRSFSASDAGMFTAAQWVLGAAGATAGGFGCDALVRKIGIRRATRYQSSIALAAAGLMLLIGALSDDVMLTVVTLCISFGCTQLTEAPMWVATMGVAGEHSQVATGMLNTGGNVPGIIGGLTVPFVASWLGWPAAIASGTVFAFVGALLWLFIRADEPLTDKGA